MGAKHIDDQRAVLLFEIGAEMNKAHLPASFISAAVQTALAFEGVADLMQLWAEETNKKERQEIVADLQELIDDCSQRDVAETAYIRFDDLDAIAKDIRAFKNSLLMKVDAAGGVSKLSEKTGIPQPSLSRFFNSSSMPRRTTLLKIAKALNLGQLEISTAWTR